MNKILPFFFLSFAKSSRIWETWGGNFVRLVDRFEGGMEQRGKTTRFDIACFKTGVPRVRRVFLDQR